MLRCDECCCAIPCHATPCSGTTTPSSVAERAIAALEAHNSTQYWLSAWSAQHIRKAAAASTARYAAGKPLSVLDGVPFVVKDCIDALPYETSYGTRFMGKL
jgi:Asp-tRNA(Asn)/Glu-tRNA(Gln) amidotransferase A subunit family amidase